MDIGKQSVLPIGSTVLIFKNNKDYETIIPCDKYIKGKIIEIININDRNSELLYKVEDEQGNIYVGNYGYGSIENEYFFRTIQFHLDLLRKENLRCYNEISNIQNEIDKNLKQIIVLSRLI